jgi:4-diphosphocytidyl-2-C-methyl-D-erythritol kinase
MTHSVLELPSYAKINWRLRVLGKRPDGFHELCTVLQTVSLADSIRFEPSDELTLECDSFGIPTDGRNLILRAAELLKRRYSVKVGARIRLLKRIPAPGGLGGGSSNGATALLGLSALWRIAPRPGELGSMAAELGSDVPFFLEGGTALGTGRGTEIRKLPEIERRSMLIVTPDVHVATADAFRGLNLKRLTKTDPESILKLCRNEAQGLFDGRSALKNDFEASVCELFPEIERVRRTLLDSGASGVLLAGSGASVFAVFDKEETRQATLKALETEFNWRKFAVATVSRGEIRAARESAFRVVSD